MVNEDRLREPLIKEKGAWRPATWEAALKAAGEGLSRAAKAKGGRSVAVLGSARLTNEAHYLLQKIGRAALGTNNLGGKGIGGECDILTRAFGLNASTATREDIAASDLVMTVGFDPEAEFSAVASMLRSAARGGTKLHVYHKRATGVDRQASRTLRLSYPDTYALFESWLVDLLAAKQEDAAWLESHAVGLDELRTALRRYEKKDLSSWLRRERVDRLRDEFFAAQRPLVVVDSSRVRDSELAALADLLMLKGAVGKPGCGILLLRGSCNGQGALDQGLDGRWLPGYKPVGDASARKALEALWGRALPDWTGMSTPAIVQSAGVGGLSAVLSWGDNGLAETSMKNAFVVAGEWIKPGAEHPADVVFPAALFLEDEGVLTSWDRRVQSDSPAELKDAPPPNWRSLGRLAETLGLPKAGTIKELHDEMSHANRLFLGWEWEGERQGRRWWGKKAPGACEGLYQDGFAHADGRARLLVPREEESRQPMELFKCLSEADLVGRFIARRLEEVRSGALSR
jgi:predicted molibdopterin-dependent oxidoreductase YjgC